MKPECITTTKRYRFSFTEPELIEFCEKEGIQAVLSFEGKKFLNITCQHSMGFLFNKIAEKAGIKNIDWSLCKFNGVSLIIGTQETEHIL